MYFGMASPASKGAIKVEKRLIDANEIKYTLQREAGGWGGEPQYIVSKEEIDKIPTVDSVEVVHGEWVWKDLCRDGSFALCCSVCLGTDGARETAHYCSECGAKMDL